MSKAVLNSIALLGCVVAVYALYIDASTTQAREDHLAPPSYFCDALLEGASCSKAITGEFGHVLRKWGLVAEGSALDVPNSALGLAFYVLALLPWHTHPVAFEGFLLASALSLAFTCYLAYVLAFVIHEFCILCASTYVLNIAIFVLAARLFFAQERKDAEQRAKDKVLARAAEACKSK